MQALKSPTRVDPEQMEVWRTLLRAHATLVRRLEADLLDSHNLPLAWYDVLARLVEAGDRRLRMSELADRVMLSPSGLTRLIDRLEANGLVSREHAEGDGRGLYAVLTDAGFQRLREASGTHLRGIHEYVISKYSPEELREVARLLERLEA
ncbi:MAG TPA: MarR family transcriptional regulator [Jiangellaceae bacterium]